MFYPDPDASEKMEWILSTAWIHKTLAHIWTVHYNKLIILRNFILRFYSYPQVILKQNIN